MEKNIMSFNELVEYGKQHGIAEQYMRIRIQRNAIEIALQILPQMQEISACDKFGIDSNIMIDDFIEKWSREAEQRWFESKESQYGEYYDYIDAFAQEKLKEFKEEFEPKVPQKKAKIVTMTLQTRVVINESAMPEVEEEEAIQKALENIINNPDGYICYDNVDTIEDDIECPYDPEKDE